MTRDEKASSYHLKIIKQKLPNKGSFIALFVLGLASVSFLAESVAYNLGKIGDHYDSEAASTIQLARKSAKAQTAACPATANPNSTEDARRVLAYIKSLPSKTANKVLSGQEFSYSNSRGISQYDEYIADVESETGHKIAVIGTDLNFGPGIGPTNWANAQLTQHWKEGGLVLVTWHPINPMTLTNINDRSINFANVYQQGTTENREWEKRLDLAAGVLKELQNNGVAVIWRPFHEMQGSWYWYGNRNRDDFINTWRHMFEYFTNHHQLNNLIWLYAIAGGGTIAEDAYLGYYPGDNYVDIVGSALYPKINTFRPEYANIHDTLRSTGKPFIVSEVGLGTDNGVTDPSGAVDYYNIIQGIKQYTPDAAIFWVWNNQWSMSNNNNIKALLDDSWVIDQDEIDLNVCGQGDNRPRHLPQRHSDKDLCPQYRTTLLRCQR